MCQLPLSYLLLKDLQVTLSGIWVSRRYFFSLKLEWKDGETIQNHVIKHPVYPSPKERRCRYQDSLRYRERDDLIDACFVFIWGVEETSFSLQRFVCSSYHCSTAFLEVGTTKLISLIRKIYYQQVWILSGLSCILGWGRVLEWFGQNSVWEALNFNKNSKAI